MRGNWRMPEIDQEPAAVWDPTRSRLRSYDELPGRRPHHKQLAVVKKALIVYQNSRRGKWTRVAAVRTYDNAKQARRRIRRSQLEVFSRFGEVEMAIRWVPSKRSKTRKRGTYGVFMRYPNQTTEPRPEVEREVVRYLNRHGVPATDTSTHREWNLPEYLAREAEEAARKAEEERLEMERWERVTQVRQAQIGYG